MSKIKEGDRVKIISSSKKKGTWEFRQIKGLVGTVLSIKRYDSIKPFVFVMLKLENVDDTWPNPCNFWGVMVSKKGVKQPSTKN